MEDRRSIILSGSIEACLSKFYHPLYSRHITKLIYPQAMCPGHEYRCYTESECSANGGRASGNCASGTYHLFQGPMLWRLFASGKFESFDKVQTQYLWPSLLCHFRSFQFYNFTLLFCQDLEFAVFSGLLIFCLVNISKL